MTGVARPIGVTIVGILVLLGGLFLVIAAVAGLFDPEVRLGASIVTLIVMTVLGLVYLAVARGIFTGNNFSRAIVGIVSVVNLVIGAYHLIFVGELRSSGLIQVIYTSVILALLYSRRATLFFAAH
jgi:hypothetical protein